MNQPHSIVFASGNQHKIAEVRNLLPANLHLQTLSDLGYYSEIPETGSTLKENALIKAQTIFNNFKVPVLADDTGLEVFALNGAPGVYSARYAGENASYQQNCEKLLVEMSSFNNRKAQFKTVFCYIELSGVPNYFEGVVEGVIATEQKGNNGFGYDSLFIPNHSTFTFAQMSAKDKNSHSHRSLSLAKLVAFLISKGQGV